MPLAEAHALSARGALAPIQFQPHDRRADREKLRDLAQRCQQFGPYVALEEGDAPESLLIDVTGCGTYFGGEDVLVGNAGEELQHLGYAARLALADTVGAAWGLSHFGGCPLIVPPGAQLAALKPLAVEALRLSEAVLERLRALGLRRIEQVLALSRADLASRMTPEVAHRLDQACGTRAELLTPEEAEEPVEAAWNFEPPLRDRRLLEEGFWRLLAKILQRIQGRGLGVQRLLCLFRTTERETVSMQVGLLRPSASAEHVFELWRLQFERVRIPSAVTSLTVRLAVSMPLEFQQGELFEGTGEVERQRHLSTLLERLSNRLGEQAVVRARCWPDAEPEQAYRCVPWFREHATAEPRQPSKRKQGPWFRPPWLFPQPIAIWATSRTPHGPPIRFRWQAQEHEIAYAWGPERIETGWWREGDVRRDYYVAETTEAQRFWLFRTLREEAWYLHGAFA